jgi:hypothetical protein
MLRNWIVAVVVAGLGLVGLTGCGAQPGKTIVTQGANSAPVMITAPQTGTYQVYTATSPNPTTTVKVREGERLGFQKNADGRWEAVAGDNPPVTLGKMTAQMYWKLREDK